MTVPFPKSIKILLLIVLSYLILVHGKPFLVPVVFAGLFAMLLLPLSRKLERWGWHKGLAALSAILLFVGFFALIAVVLGSQISDLRKNAGSIEENISQRISQIKTFVAEKIGVSEKKQEQIIQQQQKSSGNKITSFITGSLTHLGSALTDLLLVLVYLFLFLFFRRHLQAFVQKLVPDGQEEKARDIMDNSRKVAQKYLTGLALMIASLWVMYGIGFSIVGVKNAVFFAVLCGLLEIIPFVGNLAGTAITVLFALAQGGNTNQLMGIVITYALVQFIQTYLIEPLVVGKEVSIHPLFTIMGIVAGEFIWGIPGMILALPVLGVVKIICDHVAALRPYGYLIGEEKTAKSGGLLEKFKQWRKKKE